MATPAPDRSRYLDRTGICALTSASPATINYWHLHRDRTGFPERDYTSSDGRDWWRRSDIETFQLTHRAHRATGFTSVDRTGDPNDLLTAPQVARVLHYADHRSLPPTLLNCPDDVTELPSGRLRRRWYRSTVWTFADTRPDRHSTGRPAGQQASREPGSAYAEDPRLADAQRLLQQSPASVAIAGLGAELARQLGVSERTGQRLIAAARRTLST
jgi:hypothetical protein